MPLGLFHFQVLYDVLENIHYSHDEEALAKTVMDGVAAALNAGAGSIFKLLPDGQTLHPLVSYGAPIEKLRKAKFAVGKGIVGWVAQYNQPVKVDKPQQDARFMGMIDTSTGFQTKSILAAPIQSKGRCIGVIEFMNRKGGPFAGPDLDLVSMIGREVGIAFENARLFQKLERYHAFQEAVLGSVSAGVLVVDGEGRLIRMNRAAQKILKIDMDDAEEKRALCAQALAPHPALAEVLGKIMASDAPILRQEVGIAVGGKKVQIGYSGVPVKDREGSARLGSALLFQDITGYTNTLPLQPKPSR